MYRAYAHTIFCLLCASLISCLFVFLSAARATTPAKAKSTKVPGSASKPRSPSAEVRERPPPPVVRLRADSTPGRAHAPEDNPEPQVPPATPTSSAAPPVGSTPQRDTATPGGTRSAAAGTPAGTRTPRQGALTGKCLCITYIPTPTNITCCLLRSAAIKEYKLSFSLIEAKSVAFNKLCSLFSKSDPAGFGTELPVNFDDDGNAVLTDLCERLHLGSEGFAKLHGDGPKEKRELGYTKDVLLRLLSDQHHCSADLQVFYWCCMKRNPNSDSRLNCVQHLNSALGLMMQSTEHINSAITDLIAEPTDANRARCKLSLSLSFFQSLCLSVSRGCVCSA